MRIKSRLPESRQPIGKTIPAVICSAREPHLFLTGVFMIDYLNIE